MEQMKTRRIALGILVLSLLACNFVTQMIVLPTTTPIPTFTPTVTASPFPTATPLIPAYIPPQCDPAAPPATQSPDIAFHPTPEFETKQISKIMQLRILNEIEHIVEEVYIYPDYNGIDWKATVEKYREMVHAGIDTDTFYDEMQNMIFELGDEHSSFDSPVIAQMSEAELKGETEYVGVGIYHQPDLERGKLVILSTFPGSPAEHAGLQAHDSVLGVDGMPIMEDTLDRVRGPECSAVVFTVQSPGETPRDVIMIRSKVEGNILVEARLVATTDGSKIGYIFIPSFFDETLPLQVENALKGFGPLDGLIIDLRLNWGGSTSVAYPIMEYFTDGTVGKFVSRRESETITIEGNPIHNSQTVPLAVMVSKDTVSFGELFAGIMRDARDAKVTGETSLGNVEVLSGYDFDDGSQLWIASWTFDSAFSDDNWEELGIVPEIQSYASWDTFTFGSDPSIAAALELLGHK